MSRNGAIGSLLQRHLKRQLTVSERREREGMYNTYKNTNVNTLFQLEINDAKNSKSAIGVRCKVKMCIFIKTRFLNTGQGAVARQMGGSRDISDMHVSRIHTF
jgi:hypothetical protein